MALTKVDQKLTEEIPSCRYTTSVTTAIAATIDPIPFATQDFDTTSSYSSPTYTVPSDGIYDIGAQLDGIFNTLATNQGFNIFIYKNGSSVAASRTIGTNAPVTPYIATVRTKLRLVAGDTIVIRAQSNGTAGALSGDPTLNFMDITKISN